MFGELCDSADERLWIRITRCAPASPLCGTSAIMCASACEHALERPTMSINIGPPSVDELSPRITVIGVGGAGGNAIANMIAARGPGRRFPRRQHRCAGAQHFDRPSTASSSAPRSRRAWAPARGPKSAAPPPKRRSTEVERSARRRAYVLHRRRHGRRHRHRRGAGHRQGGARHGHPDRRRRHQAVRCSKARAACARPKRASRSCRSTSIR